MPKSVLTLILCVCLFVFLVSSPCAAQTHLLNSFHNFITWDWGPSNDDIVCPDFSKFPEPDPDDSWCWMREIITNGLDLSEHDLRNARIHLLGGIIHSCKFDNANLEGADFMDTKLINCSFRGANLKFTSIPFISNCDLTDAIISGTVYNLSEEQVQSTWNFKNKDFSNTTFIGCTFPNVKYDTFNFANTVFNDPGQVGSDMRNNFNLDDISWTQLPYLGWQSHHAFRTREFKQKSLHGLTIYGAIDFAHCDFSGFTLGLFLDCGFQNANFMDAERLLIFAYRDGIKVPEKYGFIGGDITEEQMKQTRFWKGQDVRGIVLERLNLDGWDFTNKDLSYASLESSSITNASFENAILYYTKMSTPTAIAQIKQTKSWKEKKIIGCTFHNVNFDYCDLSGIDFSKTKFFGCSFKNARLEGAKMYFSSNPYYIDNFGLTEGQIRSLSNFNTRMVQPYDKE